MSWKEKMNQLAFCIIAICLASVIHVESKKSHKATVSGIPNHCNETFNHTTGKVENKNFTLGHVCEFHIVPPVGNTTDDVHVYVLLETLQLHEDDSFTVKELNDTEPLFEPFSSIIGSLLLTTTKKNLTLQLNISSVDVPREIYAKYIFSSTCSFSPSPDVELFTKPLYEKDCTKVIPCNYIFNHDSHMNASFAFIFEKFNLSSGSYIKTDGLEPNVAQISGANVPPDLFSKEDQAVFEMNFDPKNHDDDVFMMRKQSLIQECSFYKGINGKELFNSPKLSAIPSSVQSECRWSIENKNNRALGVQFTSLNLGKLDVVAVVDNGHSMAPPFMQVTSLGQTEALASQIRTSGSRIIVSFKAESFLSANVSMTVFDAGFGKYMKNNGSFEANPSAGDVNGTVFLLEVGQEENVLLNFKKWDIRPPTQLEIHDDFHAQSRKIAVLTSNVWYPVLSTTSRMMIHAVNFKEGSFGGVFKGTAAGCNHMSPGKSDSYVLSSNCNSSCSWIIPPVSSDSELQLDLQYIALEKSDVINILRLDSKKTQVANITYGTTHVPMFTLDSKVGALVEVTRKECSQPADIILVAQATYLPACSKKVTLGPYEMVQLKSPNYPDTYPLFAVCQSNITRKSEKQMLYFSFDKLQLAPDHCIQITLITKKGNSSFSISGNLIPDDMLSFGDASVTFNSGNCNTTKNVQKSNVYASAAGFVMNVTSTDCGGVSTEKSGTLEIAANKSLCIWKVSVTATETSGSANVLIFNATAKDKTGNYKLRVYDGASMRENQIANLTGQDIWSRTNALIFVYEVIDHAKPSSPVSISYITHNCNTTMQCKNKLCMHPGWRCNGVNDCGDFSDEKDCGSVPVPPVDHAQKGISPLVFGVCCVIFLVLGIMLTVFLPKVTEKFKNSRYHQFRDVSVVE